jgi:uncharacterized protein YndB with AHSA1/START domain
MANEMTADATMLITYDFDAPRELVFECFIDPKHLVHWSHAGGGWVTPYAETDPRVGGHFKIGYQSGDGSEGYGARRRRAPTARIHGASVRARRARAVDAGGGLE